MSLTCIEQEAQWAPETVWMLWGGGGILNLLGSHPASGAASWDHTQQVV